VKKTVTIIFIILSAVLILDSMDFAHALAMFLLAGIIPGTNIVISATVMLEFFALVIGFVIARVCMYVVRTVVELQADHTLKTRA